MGRRRNGVGLAVLSDDGGVSALTMARKAFVGVDGGVQQREVARRCADIWSQRRGSVWSWASRGLNS